MIVSIFRLAGGLALCLLGLEYLGIVKDRIPRWVIGLSSLVAGIALWVGF